MKRNLIKKLLRLQSRFIRIASPYKTKECCLCQRKFSGFIPYRGGWKTVSELMKVLNMIGSDLDNFSCPSCLSHDRKRHLWLYLNTYGLLEKMHNAAILHFAPELHLSARIIDKQPKHYVKADLYPSAPDIQAIDLLNISFPDTSFDFVIANHVMEHVDNDSQALQEISRVLKPNGWAILQTPYSSSLQKTWEDEGINTPQQRLIAYGQEDHVRLYGQDIYQRFSNFGLKPNIQYHHELLTQYPANRYGVNEREPFMLFQKA